MPYVATDPAHDPTNPDAQPALDGWGWGEYWDIQDWMHWHQAMVQKYGLRAANETFIAYWREQGLGAAPLNDRSFDETFRQYARANGFLNDLYSGVEIITEPLGWATDIFAGGNAISSQVPNVTAAAGNLLGSVSFIWPAILLGALLIYGQQARSSAKSLFRQ